jgi:hypothetical protein
VRVRIAAGIVPLLQPQQAEVPRTVRAEARDLNVVAEQIRIFRDDVVLAGEELELVVEARPPGEVADDL